MYKEYQHLLHLLYTRQSERTLFLRDKPAFYARHVLQDPALMDLLDGLNAAQLEFYAQSLIAKRYAAVKEILPLSAAILGSAFREQFGRFSADQIPKGLHKHLEDALNFIRFLKSVDHQTPLLKDVLPFEAQLLQNQLAPKVFAGHLYAYDLPAMRRELLFTGQLPKPRKKWCLLIWRKGKLMLMLPLSRRR